MPPESIIRNPYVLHEQEYDDYVVESALSNDKI